MTTAGAEHIDINAFDAERISRIDARTQALLRELARRRALELEAEALSKSLAASRETARRKAEIAMWLASLVGKLNHAVMPPEPPCGPADPARDILINLTDDDLLVKLKPMAV